MKSISASSPNPCCSCSKIVVVAMLKQHIASNTNQVRQARQYSLRQLRQARQYQQGRAEEPGLCLRAQLGTAGDGAALLRSHGVDGKLRRWCGRGGVWRGWPRDWGVGAGQPELRLVVLAAAVAGERKKEEKTCTHMDHWKPLQHLGDGAARPGSLCLNVVYLSQVPA